MACCHSGQIQIRMQWLQIGSLILLTLPSIEYRWAGLDLCCFCSAALTIWTTQMTLPLLTYALSLLEMCLFTRISIALLRTPFCCKCCTCIYWLHTAVTDTIAFAGCTQLLLTQNRCAIILKLCRALQACQQAKSSPQVCAHVTCNLNANLFSMSTPYQRLDYFRTACSFNTVWVWLLSGVHRQRPECALLLSFAGQVNMGIRGC